MTIYLLSYLLFTITFVFYQKYQLKELKGDLSSKAHWHTLGLILRLIAAAFLLIPAYLTKNISLTDILLISTLSTTVWELLTNKITLNRNWLYFGFTSKTDKFLGKKKWVILLITILISILLKIIFPG